jgi:hypothetical protein
MTIRFRIRWREGLDMLEVGDDATLAEVLELIKGKTSYEDFTMKEGFPPKDLDLSNPREKSAASLGLKGATLMVQATTMLSEETAAKAAPAPAVAATASQSAQESQKAVESPQRDDAPPTMVEKAAGMAVDWPEKNGSLSKSLSIDFLRSLHDYAPDADPV